MRGGPPNAGRVLMVMRGLRKMTNLYRLAAGDVGLRVPGFPEAKPKQTFIKHLFIFLPSIFTMEKIYKRKLVGAGSSQALWSKLALGFENKRSQIRLHQTAPNPQQQYQETCVESSATNVRVSGSKQVEFFRDF